MDILQGFREKAKEAPKRIVFPESKEPRVIKAIEIIKKESIAYPILIGRKEEILSIAKDLNVDLDGIEFYNPEEFENLDEFIQEYYELRKHKGIDMDKAREAMEDPVFFGAMLVRKGYADGSVCGSITTTAKTVQGGLRIIKLQKGIKTLSSTFIMVHPDKKWGYNGVLLYADGAVVPNPDPEALAEIALMTAKTMRDLFKVEPIIAMLSFSTKGSAKHPDVDKVIKATEIAKKRAPDLIIDGELQVDAALIPEICERKAPGSPVKGRANVLIFPDLDAGNIAYKLTQRLAGAQAIGPILQGLAKPANDLSRGCSVDDIVNVTAITVIQAQNI